MAEELIPEADLFDAVQVAAAKLEGMDWRSMQPRAVAYAVLAEAVPCLKVALAGHQEDDEASRQQRAHDAMAAQTRERYPWIHGGRVDPAGASGLGMGPASRPPTSRRTTMAREDRQRRRGEGRVATSQHRRSTHWRPFHHGRDEARAWLDAALLLELGQERLIADAVMAEVAPSRQDGGQSAVSATRTTNEGRRA